MTSHIETTLSTPALVIDLDSTAWDAVPLPPNFGQHSIPSIAASYEKAVDDLPGPLLHAVLGGKYRNTYPPRGALSLPEPTIMPSINQYLSIPAILARHITCLRALAHEIRNILSVIDDALLNFDWTTWRRTHATADADPFAFVGIAQPAGPPGLPPWEVQLLRGVVRLRTACEDWRRVSADLEGLLRLAGQVVRGGRAPAARVVGGSGGDLCELDAQRSAWEAAFLEVSVGLFGLLWGGESGDFVFWDRKRRQECVEARGLA